MGKKEQQYRRESWEEGGNDAERRTVNEDVDAGTESKACRGVID